jgi:hypothetical protein
MSGKDAESSSDSPLEACRRRLDAAEKRYHEAVNAFEAAAAGNDKAALKAAEERRNATRQEYRQLLRVFSDLVIRGKKSKGPTGA